MDRLQPIQAGTVRPPEGKPLLHLKAQMVKSEILEALLNKRTTWTPVKVQYNKPYNVQHTGCCFESSEPGARRRTTISSHATTLFNEVKMKASRQPCARGGDCGRESFSAWAISGKSENAGQRGPGGKEKG